MTDPATPANRGESRVTEHGLPRRTPSSAQRATRWVVGAALLAWAIYEGVRGDPAPFGLAGFIVLAVLGFLVIGSRYSRIRFHSGQFHGHLLVGFHEDSFPGADVFPNVYSVKRRKSSQIGRQGLSGGKLRIQDDGITWRAGSLLTPSQRVEGDFFLPWSWIAVVDVGDVPMKLRMLGGALTIQLTEGRGTLDGEFIGSHKHLLEALRQTPLR